MEELDRFIGYKEEHGVPGLCPECASKVIQDCRSCQNMGGWGCVKKESVPKHLIEIGGQSKYDVFNNSDQNVPAVICTSRNHARQFADEMIESGRFIIWDAAIRGDCPNFNQK